MVEVARLSREYLIFDTYHLKILNKRRDKNQINIKLIFIDYVKRYELDFNVHTF
jgi:hypothetical protein